MAEMYIFMVECVMLCLARYAANENRISVECKIESIFVDQYDTVL